MTGRTVNKAAGFRDGFYIQDAETWSGGGAALLSNLRMALSGLLLPDAKGAITIVARNVPTRVNDLRRPYILIPQNAWPWHPAGILRSEVPRVMALRAGSEFFMRRAVAIMRISSAIPLIGQPSRFSPTIHNVLDSEFESALTASASVEFPAKGHDIVCIGSGHSYRNLLNLVRAYRIYREAGGAQHLFIAGGAIHPILRNRIDTELEGIDGVTIRDMVLPRPICLRLMSAAKVVALPSRVEASPISFLEAHAVNRRVVASNITGHVEMARDHGILPNDPMFFDPDDIHGIVRCIQNAENEEGGLHSILSSKEQREDLRLTWKNRVQNWFKESLGV